MTSTLKGRPKPTARDSQAARLKDFARMFQRRISYCLECDNLASLKQIALLTAQSEAPAYYVTWIYARNRVTAMIRQWEHAGHITYSANRHSRQAMIEELARRAMATQTFVGNITISEAVTRVMAEGGASSFFISPSYSWKLLLQARYHSGRRLRRTTRRRSRRLL
ncbi:MAG: hypothetical protein K2H61_05720 [Muribaculaceae bacterium]|nr:hypothetical protein [Muribaculaceae bacterium]